MSGPNMPEPNILEPESFGNTHKAEKQTQSNTPAQENSAQNKPAQEHVPPMDFWSRVRKPRFKGRYVKFLVIGSEYFLLDAIVTACERAGVKCRRLILKSNQLSDQSFIENLLNASLVFTPDALLTVNHSGVDSQGVLMDLLEKLQLPLISWFLDNPHLVLADYKGLTSQYLHIFTWDKETITSLKALGFENTYYLPLGTSAHNFTYGDAQPIDLGGRQRNTQREGTPHIARNAIENTQDFIQSFEANITQISAKVNAINEHKQEEVHSFSHKNFYTISFVGNSMMYRVEKYWKRAKLPQELLQDYLAFAALFRHSQTRSIKKFIQDYCAQISFNHTSEHPPTPRMSSSHLANAHLANAHLGNFHLANSQLGRPLFAWYHQIQNQEEKLAFEIGLIWEATRVYRLECINALMPFSPLLIGDDGWQKGVANSNTMLSSTNSFYWHAPLDYYTQLPHFYPLSTINFNCTAMQMKGATNQRVLDVPASGAFVLTDFREQIYELFEENEVVMYHSLEEIPDLVRFYLQHETERKQVVERAQKRVLSHHTWEHRVESLVKIMRAHYK